MPVASLPAAVRTSGGQSIVVKVVNGQQVSTPVTVGLVQGSLTQITGGVVEGDQVVVEGRAGAGSGAGSGSTSTSTRTRGAGQGQGQGQPTSGVTP